MGPVKQYTEQPSSEPTELVVYPGASRTSVMYDDDGHTFNYRKGEWTGIEMRWDDQRRHLTLQLARGSKMIGAAPRVFAVRVAGTPTATAVRFAGGRVRIRL